MDETITIAISLGLTSVVAASALSADGKASTATVIRWPKSPSAFAPLNILCKDGDLYWGHESPLQNARTCFGLARPNRSKAHYRLRFRLDQELIRKRGDCYRIVKDSEHDECLAQLFTSILDCIKTSIERTYRGTGSIRKNLVIVIPPYLPALCSLSDFCSSLRQKTPSEYVNISFLRQIYGVIEGYDLTELNVGNSIIHCHSEDEVTAIGLYEVFDFCDRKPLLREASLGLLTTGAWDVAENFIRVVETKSGPIESRETLQRLKEAFFMRLKSGKIKNLRVPGIPQTVTISAESFERDICLPVFSRIADELITTLTNVDQKHFVVFSGILTECGLLQCLVEDRLSAEANLDRRVPTLFPKTSRMESSGFCEGAATFHWAFTPSEADFAIVNDMKFKTIATLPAHRLYTLPKNNQDLQDQMLQLAVDFDFSSQVSLERLKSLEKDFVSQGLSDSFMSHCGELYESFCYSEFCKREFRDNGTTTKISPTLFYAVQANSIVAVELGISAGLSVNATGQDPSVLTPLHACVALTSGKVDMIKTLIKFGAQMRGFGHDCPMHLATTKDDVVVLQILEEHDGEYFQEIMSDLLQLALEVRSRRTARYLIERGGANTDHGVVCNSSFPKRSSLATYHDPLVTTLSLEWIRETIMLFRLRWPSFAAKKDTNSSHDLLQEWIRLDPFRKVGPGLDSLHYALNWGYDYLVNQISASPFGQQRILSALETSTVMQHTTVLLGSVETLDETEFFGLWNSDRDLGPDLIKLAVSKTPALKDWNTLFKENTDNCAFTRALFESPEKDFQYRISALMDLLGPVWCEDHRLVYDWAKSRRLWKLVRALNDILTVASLVGDKPFSDLELFSMACDNENEVTASRLVGGALLSILSGSNTAHQIYNASTALGNSVLATHCFRLISQAGANTDYADLALRYAYLHCLSHARKGASFSALRHFFKTDLLHWCSAQVFLGKMQNAYEILRELAGECRIMSQNETKFAGLDLRNEILAIEGDARDSMHFVKHCMQIVNISPRTVYEQVQDLESQAIKVLEPYRKSAPISVLPPKMIRHGWETSSGVHRVVLSPDGKELASFSRSIQAIKIWSLESGDLLRTIHAWTDKVEYLGLEELATTSHMFRNDPIQIWDTRSGKMKENLRLEGFTRAASTAFSPDGLLVAAGRYNGHISIWNRGDGGIYRTLKKKTTEGVVTSISFGPINYLVATSITAITLWNYKTSKPVRIFRRAENVLINSAAFRYDASVVSRAAFSGISPCLVNVSHLNGLDRVVVRDIVKDQTVLHVRVQGRVTSIAQAKHGKEIVICAQIGDSHVVLAWAEAEITLKRLCITDSKGQLQAFTAEDQVKIIFTWNTQESTGVWDLRDLRQRRELLRQVLPTESSTGKEYVVSASPTNDIIMAIADKEHTSR